MDSFFGNNNSTGGGGFMESGFNSGTSSAAPRKPMGEQTMRPVTLKQLANAKIIHDNTFRIDNADVTQVTFVAVIRQVQELSTNLSYTMEDGTGSMEVRQWIDQTETASDAQKRRELVPDMYVRVNGRLNNFGNKISCVAFQIRPITDFNEITYHFLETIHVHLSLTKPAAGAAGQSSSTSMHIDQGNEGTSLHAQVMKVIKQYHNLEEGASVDQIIHQLAGIASEAKIREAIEYLSNEGHCYTTIDDNHIKSTESY